MPDFFETLPEKYAVLLSGPKRVDKTAFCIDLMKHYLSRGETVVYMATDSGPDSNSPERNECYYHLRGT